jgi:hypothetical protein
MKEKELKDVLRRDFNFEVNWKPLFSMLFSKVQYFSNPSNPFFEDAKVISGKQTGVVKLDDGKQLAIFEVEVDDSIRIDKNRQGLREIAIRHIDQNITHGAFVFFYSKHQKDYRFSFIARWSELDLETGQFKKGETKPKRYTYLLGDNEACTTAAKRLLMLAAKRDNQEIEIKDIIDTFSVESLNKEFFKTYKEHYERFWRYIANSDNGFRGILLDTSKEKPEQQEKPIRDFAKKLLGRIVFLHFLQKKGWMGCDAISGKWENGEKQFMQLLFNDFADKAHFHSHCLTKLFFNTLNTRRDNDIFKIEGLTGTLNGSRVPYLNGGLFDTDKPEAVLSIDFPEKYFAELFDFFEQYNFTIDENSPDDHEVGIDPEMLGHIFENLLEENREKGAFYTPKEIVQYMCKESLIQYLKNNFDESVNVDFFIRNHIVSEKLAIKDNAVLLNELLDDIKVCDPAIGSGAFPIGMLQEIFEAKRFIYPYLKTSKEFNPAQVKKDIIQKSIYGVDLEKGAVDIAQLRFWLALVVDEENPHPLPNLDYKIMQGNSLLESFEGIDLSKAALFEEPKVKIIQPLLFEEPKSDYRFSDENKADIKKLVNDFFIIEDKDHKAVIRKRIDRIVLDHIDKSLEFFENRLLIEIADLEKRLESRIERLNDTQKEQYKAKSKELKEIEKRQRQLLYRNEARKKLLDFEHTEDRPYFLWHLFFMNVFEKGGFDVIIGNPPYIQLQKMGKDADILQDVGFKTFKRTGDIYTLFYEKGIEILKDMGTLTYVTSNTWMRTNFGESLREFFVTKSNPEILLNFEDTKIFPTATVEVNIMVTKKEKWNNDLQAVAIKGDYVPGNSINDYLNAKKIVLYDLGKDSWVIVDNDDFEIKKIINEKGIQLKNWNINFYRGFLTGFNDAFFINEEQKELFIKNEPKSQEVIKPLLRGRNICKFNYKFDELYVIFIPWHFPLNGDSSISGASMEAEKAFKEKYPFVYNHLLRFKDELSARNKSETGIRYEWYALQRPAATFAEEFEKEKLVWLSISDKPAFALDSKKMFVTAPAYIMTSECNKYLLTMLNSKVMEWYLDKVSSSTGQGTNQWSKIFVEQLPIPQLSEEKQKPFKILADYLILLNDYNTPDIMENTSKEMISNQFEEVLNMMVYELYFEEHMKEKEIDVLKFVDFPDISNMQTFEEKRDAVQKIYYWLKEKDNQIRNRILVSNIRSNIISRINASTH